MKSDDITLNDVKSVLFGVAIGDALGVPVDYKSRSFLEKNPVTNMIGHGTYDQEPGTFSDCSSLTFCLAEVLSESYTFDINKVGDKFKLWLSEKYWTARGKTFHADITTFLAIQHLSTVKNADEAGFTGPNNNGIGSIMRISPLVFFYKNKTMEERYELVRQVSSITNANAKTVLGCFYYLEFLKGILDGKDKIEVYRDLQGEVKKFMRRIDKDAANCYNGLLEDVLPKRKIETIKSDEDIVNTIEASIWCFMTTSNYRKAVLKAVNLGLNTSVIAAITGSLAGLYSGFNDIPAEWVKNIARNEDIHDLSLRMYDNLK